MACAGIDPWFRGPTWFGSCLPRMRGDRPEVDVIKKRSGLPRMRGDRPGQTRSTAAPTPFTPHARGSTLSHCQNPVLPRMRGSTLVTPFKSGAVYPACAGIDPRALQEAEEEAVYPACAGIDLSYMCSMASCRCLPRMRGDRPPKKKPGMQGTEFTPHARGSTFDCLI